MSRSRLPEAVKGSPPPPSGGRAPPLTAPSPSSRMTPRTDAALGDWVSLTVPTHRALVLHPCQDCLNVDGSWHEAGDLHRRALHSPLAALQLPMLTLSLRHRHSISPA